jgi:hypothetical protein
MIWLKPGSHEQPKLQKTDPIFAVRVNQGPMLWFFKYFRRKILRKNWRFRLKTKLNFEKS